MRKELALLITVLFLLLLVTEAVLRWGFNFMPGYYARMRYQTETRNLKILTGYVADSNGIMRVEGRVAADVADLVKCFADQPSALGKFQIADTVDPLIYTNIFQACAIINGDTSNALGKMYAAIKLKPDSLLTDIEQGVLQYIHQPYNKDGFRSISFSAYAKGKKKVLLLGDSFTWGGVAYPINNSFADLLLTMGYTVYNTGIPCTDPEQYFAVAQKYIRILKPDVVVVNLFAGNDLAVYERPVLPFAPAYYPTNAGNLLSCPQGKYLKDMEEAYQIILSWYKIPVSRNWFNRWCAKTSVTSACWSLLAMLGCVNKNSEQLELYNEQTKHLKEPGPVCQRVVGNIKKLCIENGAHFIYSQIPDYTTKGMRLPKDAPGYADTISYYIPKVEGTHYSDIGGHFNNEGHLFYANYLQNLIDSVCHGGCLHKN